MSNIKFRGAAIILGTKNMMRVANLPLVLDDVNSKGILFNILNNKIEVVYKCDNQNQEEIVSITVISNEDNSIVDQFINTYNADDKSSYIIKEICLTIAKFIKQSAE